MSEIDYQALRKAAQNYQSTLAWYQEKPDSPNAEQDCDAALAAFKREIRHREVDIIAGLLDELDEKQQYIKLRDQENEDIALTVGKLRVELEGKDKLIAELRKQCAEWERKALSNFEECAAMAERIEKMSKQSCEARERDLFESWVMHSICISKSTLEGLRTETGYRNATLSGTDFNRMWEQWKSIRAAGIRTKGE